MQYLARMKIVSDLEKAVLGQADKSQKAAETKRQLHHGNAEPTP
jgi:hypothetical protein